MQRAAWLLHVRDGKEREYRLVHAAVWPDLIDAARHAGITNHSCFLSGRSVIVYLEAENVTATLAKLLDTEVKKRWDAMMSDIIEASDVPAFDEVFHFD